MQIMKALKTALIRIMQLTGNSAANGLTCRPYATGRVRGAFTPCGRGAGSERAVHGSRSKEAGCDEANHAGL